MFLLPKSSYTVRATPKKGKAVFASNDISAGTIIGDYLGTLRRPEEENEKRDGLYTIALNEVTDAIGDPNVSGIHLINHSCAPNCGMYPYKGHTLYIAVRKIFKGEELTVDYLIDPPEGEDGPCTHTCHCDTEFCRGTMHSSFHVTSEWEDYFAKMQKGYYTKPLGTYGTKLELLDQYPENVSDVELWTLIAHKEKPISRDDAQLPPLRAMRVLIREEGRPVRFPNIGVDVEGVIYGRIIVKDLR